jgi:Uma2 family endonuclease
MASPVKILPHYTYADYAQWEGRWELIEGIPYAMSPAPSPRHQWISANIKYELKDAIKKTNCRHCRVYDFIDFLASADTVLQPDALVVCGDINKQFLDFPPALVVEILSPATSLKDRNNKFYIYESHKIPYYLIVDPETERTDLFKLNTDHKYVLDPSNQKDPYVFHLEEGCDISVVLDLIWQ